jgi:hypothetical protein
MLRTWSEEVGQHLDHRSHLRVAICRGLHDRAVQAHRPLRSVDERVQRADHVVACDADVDREMVACARRDTPVLNVVLGGDSRDRRL